MSAPGDVVEALGLTAEDAEHDAECEHFMEAAMLSAQLVDAESRLKALCEAVGAHLDWLRHSMGDEPFNYGSVGRVLSDALAAARGQGT